MRRRGLIAVLVAVSLAAAGFALVPSAVSQTSGVVVVVDPPGAHGYVCSAQVDLDLLKITITPAHPNNGNAFTIAPGCTGTIDRLEIDTAAVDGVKCLNNQAQNGHDLEIGGGYIRAHGASGHADGFQCMGGDRIVARNLLIDYRGSPGGGAWYPSLGGLRTGGPPTGIVCDGCHLIHGATSVRVDAAETSGVRNSVICDPLGAPNEHAVVEYEPGLTGLVDPVGVSEWPVTIRRHNSGNVNLLSDGNVAVPSSDPRCSTEPDGDDPPPTTTTEPPPTTTEPPPTTTTEPPPGCDPGCVAEYERRISELQEALLLALAREETAVAAFERELERKRNCRAKLQKVNRHYHDGKPRPKMHKPVHWRFGCTGFAP